MESKEPGITRRGFVKRTAVASAVAAGAPTIIPASVLGADGHTAPSNRVVLGAIGVGSRGTGVMTAGLELSDTQVVAVCDVKADRRATVSAHINEYYGNTDCVAYQNHEEIVARDDVDGFIIASCDHWHVLHALAATRAGKGVYLEKPMGLTIAEDIALREAVRKHKTVFQFGTQQRSNRLFRQACELVRNGYIGELQTINVWAPPSIAGGSLEQMAPPETLDYERWLGPAPATPYTKDRESNQWWWFISDYALGFIAGWGIHPLDIALWGAGDLLRTRVEVEGVGAFPKEGLCNTATDWDVVFSYDSGVRMNYRAQPAPPIWTARYEQDGGHGTAFEGTEGWVQVKRNHISTYPENLKETTFGDDDIRLYESNHHVRNFVDCIKSGRDPICPIEEGVEADVLCHLAEAAIRLERRVHWNPKKDRFIKDDEANARLSRPMREPWRLDV